MIEVEKIQSSKVALLFNGVEDSMVKSCLQGYMGSAFVHGLRLLWKCARRVYLRCLRKNGICDGINMCEEKYL